MTQASNLGKGGSNFNSSGQLSLTAGVTGILPAANGGTGSATGYFASGTALLFQQTAAPTGWTKSTTHDNKALRVVSGTASSGGTVAFTTAFASQAVSGTVGTSGSTTATGTNATVTGTVSTSITGVSGSVSTTVGNTTLTTSTMPYHGHAEILDTAGLSQGSGGIIADSYLRSIYYRSLADTYGGRWYTTNTGGDGAHNHSGSSSFSFSSGTASSSFTGSAPAFTGTAHTHTGGTFTGTAINLAVQYVDAIICTKD